MRKKRKNEVNAINEAFYHACAKPASDPVASDVDGPNMHLMWWEVINPVHEAVEERMRKKPLWPPLNY